VDNPDYDAKAKAVLAKAGPMLPKHITADSVALALQLQDDLERSGVARAPHAHHFPVRMMLEDGPVMGDCECGMTFDEWDNYRD